MTILLNFLWTAFSALRTYGLCGGWWLTGLVGILSSAQVLTNLYGFFFARYSRMHDLPVLGAVCIGESDLIPTTASKLALSSRICTIIADVIILAHIWQKTYFLKKDVCRGCRLSQLEVILQRDGAVYFLAILILNALQIVLLRIELYYLTSALSSVIISRFLLNIREAAYAPIDDFNSLSFSSHSRFPSLRFETPGSSIAEQPSTVTQLTDVEMSWDDGDHERGNVGSDVTVRRIIRDSEGTTRELRVMKQ
ncbi:hypothetical protein CERSUDRAFT_117814 [Gelatoporia subvermispora B]|uniref:Uncharacterized protein n=1 Tax=Ceriporiopsis subvermispora (strain B) TaxID=914234 RepID=M2R6D6_CERS8|nr:hypothetical protein CERSUDRAFT_117814 [Gelatoporia subvermispora B]